MRKTIHLFRHGLTDWNSQLRLQGHTDIPLNEEGRQQALSLQLFFRDNPVEFFVSSDLTRAQQTAHIANHHLAKPMLLQPGFREVNMGKIEGMTREAVAQEYGPQAWEKWVSVDREHFDFAFPDAENTWATVERFSAALSALCEQHDFDSIGLCTHGLAMRRFLHSLRPDITESLPTPNCVVYTIEWDSESKEFYFNS
ncbi:histidine phosphatase family protein [Bdellovibrio bacteriovorus]|uniref:Phosphoglycerate mutase n=1 Tax=Bdellovibrio bacteriovorus TaxID=959 RepID=A0A1Z3N941_BDEBC|nr:histidine phosphatase family protein [Bdellovibrio bacteriovorus]ASD63993.1 hypothetical protein B9G79_10645 [Bdellovibrio bacteriovorus]